MKRITLAVLMAIVAAAAVRTVPAPPVMNQPQVVDSTVALSWTVPFGATGIRLEAGTAPALTDIANSLIAAAGSYTATNVPPGTYYVRVRAADPSGESAPSNEVVVAVGGSAPSPGCSQPPNPPALLAPSVNGNSVSFMWSAAAGCPATGFTLHAGTGPGLSNIAIVNVGNLSAFTASAPNGTYYVRVIAQNAFGASAASNDVIATIGTTTPATPTGVRYSGVISIADASCATTVGVLPCRTITLTPTTAAFEAVLQWQDPNVDLDFFLYQGTSRIAASVAPVGATQERVSANVQIGVTYQLRIVHWGSLYGSAASQAYTVAVNQSGGAPPPSVPPPTGRYRLGARCRDGSLSSATGSGACSHHGGVSCWRYSDGTCTNPDLRETANADFADLLFHHEEHRKLLWGTGVARRTGAH